MSQTPRERETERSDRDVELSVIVPTLAGPDSDIEVLEALDECDFEGYEILLSRARGASRARNVAADRASSDKLVFLDDDSKPRRDYLAAVSAALDEHDAVTGLVVQPEDAPFRDMDIPWYDQGDEVKQTTLVAGCNMAVRREVMEAVGGFDERFHHGHEETELAARIDEGHDIYYHPEMVVEHPFTSSTWGYWMKSFRHGRADVQLWGLHDEPWRRRLVNSLPVSRPNAGPVEFVSRFFRRFGRIAGLKDQLFG
jgi:GT2 family glycosyltransferase